MKGFPRFVSIWLTSPILETPPSFLKEMCNIKQIRDIHKYFRIFQNIIQYLDFISEFTRYLEISNDNIEWSKPKLKIDTVKKNNEWSIPKRLTKKLLVVFVKKATL